MGPKRKQATDSDIAAHLKCRDLDGLEQKGNRCKCSENSLTKTAWQWMAYFVWQAHDAFGCRLSGQAMPLRFDNRVEVENHHVALCDPWSSKPDLLGIYCNSKHGNTITQHESGTAEDTRELQINKSTKSCMTTHQCGAPASDKFAQLHTVEAYYLTPLYQAAARVIRSNNAKQALCLNRIILSHAVAFFWPELGFFCMLLLWFPGQTFSIVRLSPWGSSCESCNPVNIKVIFYEGTVWPKIGVDASRLMMDQPCRLE